MPELDLSCPVVTSDTRPFAIGTLALFVLCAVAAAALLAIGQVKLSGAMTLAGTGMQIADVLSDVGFVYQLAQERWCERPGFVLIGLGSVGGAVVLNVILIVVLLQFWRVEGMREHMSKHWSIVAATSFLALFGLKSLELMTSSMFGVEALSLYGTES